ncbi:hypothetical protein NWF32_17110 [Pseudomonas qingdaonensis]|nr:hypothetical protein [Pseudomonas qingdaonensis]
MLPDQLDQVPQLARAVVFAICETMGGSVVYIPRGDTLRKALRDAEIFRAWRENNTRPDELARKFDLASQTVYDIIARQRELHRRAEPDLFGYEEHPRDCTNHPQSPALSGAFSCARKKYRPAQ